MRSLNVCDHLRRDPLDSVPAEPLGGPSSPLEADLPSVGPAMLLSAAAPVQQRQTMTTVPLGSVYPEGTPGKLCGVGVG